MHTTQLSACLRRNYSNLARKVYKNQPKAIRDNIEYCDILTHDNRHQLYRPSLHESTVTRTCAEEVHLMSHTSKGRD